MKKLLYLKYFLVFLTGAAGICAGLVGNLLAVVAFILVLIQIANLETAEQRIQIYKKHNEFLWDEIQKMRIKDGLKNENISN